MTDYILDELLTPLKMRKNYRVVVAAGEALWQQRVARIEHITLEDIARTWEVFRQYHDKDWRQYRKSRPVSPSCWNSALWGIAPKCLFCMSLHC